MTRPRIFAFALLCSAALAGPALAGELVVLDAKGVELAAGQTLDGKAPLKLPDGAKVTLVGADGTTIKLKGPFDGAPESDGAAGGNRVAESLQKMVSAREGDATALGAARAAGGPAELPEPWLVDATVEGNVCLKEGTAAVLWRPAADAAAELALMPVDRSWTAKTPWPAGEARLALPEEVPFADGETFLTEISGTSAALTVHILPEALKTDAMRAAFLATKGCDRQLAALRRQTVR